MTFWAGIAIGFALSVAFWLLTTKGLIARIDVSKNLFERTEPAGRLCYYARIRNTGGRDAVDVSIRCTLYSRGWATDPPGLRAVIALPIMLNGSIDLMPGRHRMRKILRMSRVIGKPDPMDALGARRVVFYLGDLSNYQKAKIVRSATYLVSNCLLLSPRLGVGIRSSPP
jgi:hypothetical protein